MDRTEFERDGYASCEVRVIGGREHDLLTKGAYHGKGPKAALVDRVSGNSVTGYGRDVPEAIDNAVNNLLEATK